MLNGQLEQRKDQIGAEVERLEISWAARLGKPELVRVAVSGRPYGDPHPILAEIFKVLSLPQGGNEQLSEFGSLRKECPSSEFKLALRRLQLNLSLGKMKKLAWEGSHVICFQMESESEGGLNAPPF